MDTSAKSIISMFIILLLSFISIIGITITLFLKDTLILISFIIIALLSISGLLVSWVKTSKTLFVISISALVIIIILYCVHAIINNYHNNIPVVKESSIVIYDYEPFSPGTKIAVLPHEASFHFDGETPRIDGATALYPLYSAFAHATYPQKYYDPMNSEVLCSKTALAYQNLINRKVDLIFCAEPSKQQIELAKEKGVIFEMTPIGKEAFVFFVNSKNPIMDISSEDIINIYTGKIVNWKQLGGKDKQIKVFQRPENSGSQTMLLKILGIENIIEPLTSEVIDGMGGIIEKTADYKNYENSIGYSFLFYTTEMIKNDSIRLLSIDSVLPNVGSIQSGEYAYSSPFFAITLENPLKCSKDFIAWILSKEGQYLVTETGYVSIN